MKIVFFGLFCFIFLWTELFAETPVRISGDKIEFSKCNIEGIHYWTDADKQTAIDSQKTRVDAGTGTVDTTKIIYEPSKYEVWVATCIGVKFKNTDDYKKSLTDKSHLFEKIRPLKADYDLAVELGDNKKANNLLQRYEALKEIYDSLQ